MTKNDWQQACAGNRGAALVLALIAIFLIVTVGLALALVTNTELVIAGNYSSSQRAFYAAEAGLELALEELIATGDWNSVLLGATVSTRSDGPPSGARALPDGTAIDLTEETNLINCGRASGCSWDEMSTPTAERPWGVNNPRWTPYLYGPLPELLPGVAVDGSSFVLVWVADDSAENDGDPLRDDAVETNAGSGAIALRSAAYGSGGTRKVIEATIARTPANRPRIVSWHEISGVHR